MKRILIIGSGISGLSTAWWLHKKYPNCELTILEKHAAPGGLVHTEKKEDFFLDLGPKGFLRSGEGRFTLQLIEELGLTDHLVASDPSAKTRFVHYKGKTRKISLWTLLKNGLPLSLIKDFFAPCSSTDSTVQSFLHRHSTARLIRYILNPAVLATCAGHSSVLSSHMALPTLSYYEATTGSLLRGYIKNRHKKERGSYLLSLRPCLGILIETLVQKLPVTWVFSSPATRIDCSSDHVQVHTHNQTFHGEYAIYTGSASRLPSLLPLPTLHRLASQILEWNLSCVTLGWRGQLPLPKGYGVLFADEPPLLGMVYHSRAFPKQSSGKTLLSLLLDERWYHEDAYAFASAVLSEHLGITQPPDVFSVFSPEEGLPQHRVGFPQIRDHLLPQIPHRLKIVGQNVFGPGLNRCIASAYRAAASL